MTRLSDDKLAERDAIAKTIAGHIGFRMAVAVAAPQDAQRNIADLAELLADSIVSELQQRRQESGQ